MLKPMLFVMGGAMLFMFAVIDTRARSGALDAGVNPAPLPPGTVSGKGYGQYLYGRRIA
jgi:hypothetical protein